jgi:SAM-dependent methyltransferase
MGILTTLIHSQRRMSKAFDSLLPCHFRIDGHLSFRQAFAPPHIRPDIEVWDVGGGKFPFIDANTKRLHHIHSVGLDISGEELAGAATGTYDETFVADITKFVGRGTADLIICQAVLEHVRDTAAALRAFETILKPNGIALVFVPARNSWFARLNLLLPEKLKLRLLTTFHREWEGGQGFPSYYDRCTGPDFRRMAGSCGLDVVDEHFFHESGYFNVAFPIHVLWRLWVLLGFKLDRARWAETFCMAMQKQSTETPECAPVTKETSQPVLA